MKKLLAMLLAAAMLLSMVSCSPSGEPTQPAGSSAEESTAAPATDPSQTLPAETTAAPTEPAVTEPVTEPPTEPPTTEPVVEPELTPEEKAKLPEVGQVIKGFETKEIREYPILGAKLVYMVHQKTGSELLYIANNDTNRYFALTFGTQAIDNTGLPHVFEHATLSGSQKYPSADLFMNLSYQTYQTLMNAYTYDRMTMYPLGSLSQEQLLALADYYIDSCFHPMIMEDESIFKTEAWRYRAEKASKPLTLEGTVYSEMKGAMTLERQANYNWIREALPGAFLGYNQGGDPDYIPDMTWDSLKAYHDMFYHPSNCLTLLYGQVDNYRDFLALLDAEFSQYEAREFEVTNPDYVPLTESVVKEVPYPTEASTDPSRSSCVEYAIVLPEEAWEQSNALSYLTSLLCSTASPLAEVIKTQFPYASVSGGLEIAGPVPVAIFTLYNAEREDAEAFKAAVDAAIADVIENGFPKEMLDSYAASFAISDLLAREDNEVGESVMSSVAYDKHTFGDIWYYFDSSEEAELMVPWNENGTYSALASKYLSGEDVITALVTTYPEPGLQEQKDKELKEKLAAIKESMTTEEIKAIVKASTTGKRENPATAEMVKQLTVVDVASLPEEIREYEVSDTSENGIRYIEVAAAVSGVTNLSVNLDASFLDGEGLHYLKLYKDLIAYLDTAQHTRADLKSLQTRYLYEGHVYVSLMRENDSVHPFLQFTWMALDDDLQTGMDLMREMFFELKIDDAARLQEGVEALLIATKNDVNGNPYSEAIRRSFGRTAELYRYSAYLGGVEYYVFLSDVLAQLKSDPQVIIDKLAALRDSINSRHDSLVILAGGEESVGKAHQVVGSWLATLEDTEHEKAEFELPMAAAKEAIVVESNVQYNGLAADFETLGIEYDAGLVVVAALITDKYLIPQLRDGYGVYGVMHYPIEDTGIYMCTYRDPNVSETFTKYAELSGWLSRQSFKQEDIDGYILSSYVDLAMPSGELAGAIDAASSYLGGVDADKVLQYMREIKAVTPEKVLSYVDMYKAFAEKGNQYTAGGAAALEANADRYESVLNPFGVVDPTKVDYTDVAKDSPWRDDIYYALGTGFIKPAGEGLFDPDGTVTVGDLATYLYVLVGGNMDAEAALSFLQGYGIFPASAKVGDDLTREQAAYSSGIFMELTGNTIQKKLPADMKPADAAELTAYMKWALKEGVLKMKTNAAGEEVGAQADLVSRAEYAHLLKVFDGLQ
jgi:Zn-dependent M16 (insulinase) family peptidase